MSSFMQIILNCSTWQRDSHGLYDYDSKNYTRNRLVITNPIKLVRSQDNVFPLSLEIQNEDTDFRVLANIMKENQQFILNRGVQYSEKLWLVVRNLGSKNGYQLSNGDVIRFGRISLRVYDIGGVQYQTNSYQTSAISAKLLDRGGLNPSRNQTNYETPPLNVQEVDGQSLQCRICLLEEPDEGNPLISPCKCTGTMAYVHLSCLQTWLFNKVVTRDQNGCKTYSLQALECELCKMKYPDEIECKGISYKLMEIPRPQGVFIMLEEVTNDQSRPQVIHTITFDRKFNIRVGRGHDSDVRVQDISVSRSHAYIRYAQDGIFIDDFNSKFGTLVQIRRPILLDQGSRVCIQAGRTVLDLQVKKRRNWMSCFGGCKSSEGVDEPIKRVVTEDSNVQNIEASFDRSEGA